MQRTLLLHPDRRIGLIEKAVGNQLAGFGIVPVVQTAGDPRMTENDVSCPECGAGFRRLELSSAPGEKGEYRCPACDSTLETFDGRKLVAYRMTIGPSTRALRD